VLFLLSAALAVSPLLPEPRPDARVAYPQAAHIPVSILRNATDILVDRVGPDFFADAIRLDTDLTQLYEPPGPCAGCGPLATRANWIVVFRVRIPGQPWEELSGEVRLWTDGTLAERFSGLPPCATEPGRCVVALDRDEAESVARRHGLSDGDCPFETHLFGGWSHIFRDERFHWQVIDMPCALGGPFHGVVIDARGGHVGRLRGFVHVD
jgi:hypothetical protein